MTSTDIIPYIGTVPQWGALVAIITAILVFLNKRKELTIGEAAALRKIISDQARECEETKAALNKRIDGLLNQLLGEKTQRIAEQIALIGLIMKTAPDTKEFQGMLQVLEAVQDQIEKEHPSQNIQKVRLKDNPSD